MNEFTENLTKVLRQQNGTETFLRLADTQFRHILEGETGIPIMSEMMNVVCDVAPRDQERIRQHLARIVGEGRLDEEANRVIGDFVMSGGLTTAMENMAREREERSIFEPTGTGSRYQIMGTPQQAQQRFDEMKRVVEEEKKKPRWKVW